MRPFLAAAALVAAAVCSSNVAAGEGARPPRACLVIEGERVLERGAPLAGCATSLALSALREEHAAFQIVVEAGDEPLDGVTVGEGEPGEAGPAFELFIEHFVDVPARSRNERRPGSLAFSPDAEPPDEGMLGSLPDALLPLEGAPWAPYPLSIAARSRRVLFADTLAKQAGSTVAFYEVRSSKGPIARLEVSLDVAETKLPYQAVSMFAFYERSTLEERFTNADKVERQTVQMLHAHHLDAITDVLDPADIDRLQGYLSGAWFTDGALYRGPGAGVPPELLAIGAYGALGPPGADKIGNIAAIASRAPSHLEEVFVYAIDETCESPYGAMWKQLLRDADLGGRIDVLHTCHEDPRGQDVDIVMIPGQAFDPDTADEARARGKKVWIYNGMLPHAAPMSLDVPLTALTLNGWIAASFDVGRWFYWETIFWNDGNRGGKGPRDVFATAETFHNSDTDTSLYDGLLLFPGRMPKDMPAHDLGVDAVLPSLRLKSIRRGSEDAGLLALAAQVDAARTFAISKRIVGAALDEAQERSPTRLELDPKALAAARAELRSIIASEPTSSRSDAPGVTKGLSALRAARSEERRGGTVRRVVSDAGILAVGAIAGALFAFGFVVAFGASRRRPSDRRRH